MWVFDEAILNTFSPAIQRKVRNGALPAFTPETLEKARKAFTNNPNENMMHVYPDGLVIGAKEEAGLLTSRDAQVAFAEAHGWFPVTVSRVATELWRWIDE